jgi:GNAT superfamily N-acetyltransferase
MVVTTSAVDLSIQQFVGAWRLMCSGGPGQVNTDEDGIHYIFSGVPIPFFNVALLTERGISGDALRSSARRACEWASRRSAPWLFVATHETLEAGVDATAVLDACGLAPMMPLTGMIAQRISPPERITHDLELTRPTDDEGCSAIVDVNTLAYGMDLYAGKGLIGTQSFWKDHFPVLGLTGGKPASSAAVMMVDGYRYVALVATDPAQQRRGFAEAAMRRALELAAGVDGDVPTVLHATAAGRPIYERMGYTAISQHTIFMEQKFLGGH